MTLEKQLEIIDEMYRKRVEILIEKGHDYANEDRLSNFKAVAFVKNSSPELECLSEIVKKVVRLTNLLSTKKSPKNESVQDSILDLLNYTDLLNCILTEKQENLL